MVLEEEDDLFKKDNKKLGIHTKHTHSSSDSLFMKVFGQYDPTGDQSSQNSGSRPLPAFHDYNHKSLFKKKARVKYAL
jgi:hypothetical protein